MKAISAAIIVLASSILLGSAIHARADTQMAMGAIAVIVSIGGLMVWVKELNRD